MTVYKNGIAILTVEGLNLVGIGSGVAATDGDFGVVRLANLNEYYRKDFVVPSDFNVLTEAVFVVIPKVTQAVADWDIASDYAAIGEAYNTHSEADAATTYNVTLNQLFEVDISGILSSIVAGDNVGISITLANAAHDVDILGIRLKSN